MKCAIFVDGDATYKKYYNVPPPSIIYKPSQKPRNLRRVSLFLPPTFAFSRLFAKVDLPLPFVPRSQARLVVVSLLIPIARTLDEVYAKFANSSNTRAVLDESLNAKWTEGDSIFVTLDGYGLAVPYYLTNGNGNELGLFHPKGDRKLPFNDSSMFGGVYGLEYREGAFYWNTERQYCEAYQTVGPMLAPLKSDYSPLVFKSIGGILVIRVNGNGTVSRIELSTDSRLGGTVTFSQAEPVLDENGPKTATIVCGNGILLNEYDGTDFSFAIPSGDYHNLTIKLVDIYGQEYEKSMREEQIISIKAGYMYRLSIYDVTFQQKQ